MKLKFKILGTRLDGRLPIYQCDTEKVAGYVFKNGLVEFMAPRNMWPKPLNESKLGHQAIYGSSVMRVRYSIFASLEFSEGR